jgi:hypothetical protein
MPRRGPQAADVLCVERWRSSWGLFYTKLVQSRGNTEERYGSDTIVFFRALSCLVFLSAAIRPSLVSRLYDVLLQLARGAAGTPRRDHED